MKKEYSKDYFQLVQEDERLLDKPLKTKQLSYFQDAMLRFTKNKYNVIATVILGVFILMSIFVPILTPKTAYDQTNSALKTLPPRIPLIEKLGIFDGVQEYLNQTIDYDTIDPVTGLGYPTERFQVEYIFLDTLTNNTLVGTVKDPAYRGGTNELYVNYNKNSFGFVVANTEVDDETGEESKVGFVLANGSTIEVDVNEMQTTGVLELYLAPTILSTDYTSYADLTLLGTVTQDGITSINPMDALGATTTGFIIVRHVLPELSLGGDEYISLESVSIKYNDEVTAEFSGYSLSASNIFTIDTDVENGRLDRKNAVITRASFTYDSYAALLRDRERTMGEVEYLRILADNPGMLESIVYGDAPNTWTFGEGYPITEVVGKEVKLVPGTGKTNTNYFTMVDGKYALEFDSEPYFIFGTDTFGKDLFTLIWLGLRTSLLLGFLAAAVNIVLGVIWGATSAYYGGQVDILMERFLDIWGSFPQITMIGIITVLIGPGFLALFIFMVYDGWIGAAKVTRFQFYRYKGREYVLAARTLGASDGRIIFKHILPNALGTIVTRVVLSIPAVIFLEVNLSYLGFGIGNGQKLEIGPIKLTGTSIGVILKDGQEQILSGNTWLIIFPTLIVAILMITFNMFGNALRDALNPQLRGSE
ncbi:MAG: ABC transporter permease [Acholeplasmataceae bacterium]|nr:ABC transporter permease [Acholeplasmataceae bacterium]